MTMGLWPYLDVDVVLALDDDLDVGVMDGLLVVLDASRPIGCRTQHLLHTDRKECYRGDSATTRTTADV